jgi:ribosomal protein S18 acetylase RimI-like enzyme
MTNQIQTSRRNGASADINGTVDARASIGTRPLGPGDREPLARFFTRLGPESRYRRFFALKRELTPRELDWLTAIDHIDHEAIVAVDRRDGSIVGVCRYVREPDRPMSAELAIAVADACQEMGIGTILGEQVVRRAVENGFTQVRAFTLSGNRSARSLLRRLGFQIVRREGSEVELVLELRGAGGIVLPLRGAEQPPP